MSEEIPEKRKFESVEEEEVVLAEKKQAIGDKDAVAPISTPIASTSISGGENDVVAPISTSIASASISAPEELPITVNMSIPQTRVPALIGKKGIVVKEIAHQSNCKIYVEQNFPEGQPRQVILTGKSKDLSLAMSLVTKIIENGPSSVFPSIPTPDNLEPDATEFYVPHPKVGTVIGFRGSNVSEINRRTGCRVSIVQEGVPEGADRKVNFFGTPEQVAEAKAMVLLLMEEGALPDMPGSIAHSSSNSGGSNKRPIDNGPGSSGGRNGSRFGDNSGAAGGAPSPYGPSSGQNDHYGGSGGNNRNDGYNSNSYNSNNNNPNGLITTDTDIEPDKVRTLIGSKGVTINELMDRSGCKIVVNQKFPEGQMHKVMYNGTRPQVDIAIWLVGLVRNFGITGLHNTIGKYGMVLLQEVELFQNQMLRLQAGGSSAVSLNDIQTRCSVKIGSEPLNTKSVNPDSGFLESVHKITVMGSQDNVSAALRMLSNATRSGGGRDDYSDPYSGNNQRGGGGGRSPQRQPQYGGNGGSHHQQQQQQHTGYGGSDTYGSGGGGRYGEEYNPSAAPVGGPSSNRGSAGPGNNYYGSGGGGGGAGAGPADSSNSGASSSSGGAPMLVLGEDGSSGHLEAAVALHDGLQLQVAMIRPNALPRLVGEQHANIALIKEKSGSSLQVLKGDAMNPNTTVIVIGLPQCVTLAAQMIQEVLVNGTAKLQRMAEIPMSTALVAATSAHLAAYLAKRAGNSGGSGAGAMASASHTVGGSGGGSYGGGSYGSGGGGYGGDAYGSAPRGGGHGAYGQQQQQSYGGRR